MRTFRKATIKDVAQHAGVSTTTVSVFVSGREDVCSPETAERIRTAIAALHYTPSSLTGGLRRQATSTIGVCIHSPFDVDVAYGTLFFEKLWRGITREADREDYALLHYPAAVREGESSDAFLDGRVGGMLFHSHDNARPARVAAAGMPAVLLTRSLDLPEGCGAAYADEAQTADLALSHLWDLGHRRIAHVAGPVELQLVDPQQEQPDDIALRRRDGYVAWMQAHSAYDPDLIAVAGGWKGNRVPEIVAAWTRLPEPPTAAFCANDALALAVIAAARRRGWRVPEDLSVVGVDNSPAACESDIPLTSVEAPVEAVGREGMRALFRSMRGAPLEECRIALPVSDIVVRSSTARCTDRFFRR